MPHPRENEAGGKYGRGIISKRYSAGQVSKSHRFLPLDI